MIRPSPLVVALLLVSPVPRLYACSAQDEDQAGEVRAFDRLQVTATRTQRALIDVPGTVDVIDREQLDNQLTHELKDMFRYTPGVSAPVGAGRFSGSTGIRIRGLDGNRVAILVDGIPVSDTFNFGSYLRANRDFVDLETLKRVEIVRGPASALYGSDALGGVVSYLTKDPADYLRAGQRSAFGLKMGYEGNWNGLFAGVTSAFGSQYWSGLVAVSHSQGQQTENQGNNRSHDTTRTAPNPQRIGGSSVLTKLEYAPNAQQRFKLTLEGNENHDRIEALSGIDPGVAMPALRILSQRGRDRQVRERLSLRHELDHLDTAFADSLQWQVYRQDSQSVQHTDELRGNNTQRHYEHNFDQRLYGLQLNAYKSFENDFIGHAVSYGLDGTWTDTHEKRDGNALNLATGMRSNRVGQDVFPVRDFPITQTSKLGLYLQDEMRLGNGRFSLTPGVRVDHYRLSPRPDAIFVEDNPGVAVAKVSDHQISPKLGLVWRFSEEWSAYANYAHGFRAPPYNDVNIGFTNLQARYTAIANPDLKPETSKGGELGLRFTHDAAYFGLSVYYTDYRDFIDSYAFAGFNADGFMLFQSRNFRNVVIKGAEARGGLDLGQFQTHMNGWSLQGAVASAYGDNLGDHTPLDSIDPLRGTLGLAYTGHAWGAELMNSFVARKHRPPLASDYTPGGYATLDLMTHWEFAPNAKLTAGVFNLADRHYIDWNALPPATLATSRVLDRYSGAGRTLSLSLAVNW